MRYCEVIYLTLVGILCCEYIQCTTGHNLHKLLRHPHFSEGHQHASLQHHLQNPSSYPPKKHPAAWPSYPSPYSSSFRSVEQDSWSRTSPVTKMEYYKMAVKSTTATKSAQSIDPQIPQELSDVREANEHFVRMRLEVGCRIPRPQVVCVRDVYPEKNILPRCTLLHRCTEMTGCCEDEMTQCSPKAMQEVVMLFYVLGEKHRSTNVEKLLFVNHTECECQAKPNSTSTVTTTLPPTTANVTATTATTTTSAVKSTEEQYPLRDQKYNKCRSCPSPFFARELDSRICSCDCFDRHKPCIRIKRGREALPDTERRCVLAGQCHVPECDYGSYDPDRGRCPKKPNANGYDRDLDGYKGNDHHYGKRPNHKNPEHRWNYFERD